MRLCAVCQCEVPQNRLMCDAHWRLVPKPTQARVWRDREAVRADQRSARAMAQYRESVTDAIDHVRTYFPEQVPAVGQTSTRP